MPEDFIAFYPETDKNCKYCSGRGYLTGPNAIMACFCGEEPKWVKEKAKKLWRKRKK